VFNNRIGIMPSLFFAALLIPPATMVFLSRSKTPPVGRLRVVSLPFEDLRAVS